MHTCKNCGYEFESNLGECPKCGKSYQQPPIEIAEKKEDKKKGK